MCVCVIHLLFMPKPSQIICSFEGEMSNSCVTGAPSQTLLITEALCILDRPWVNVYLLLFFLSLSLSLSLSLPLSLSHCVWQFFFLFGRATRSLSVKQFC